MLLLGLPRFPLDLRGARWQLQWAPADQLVVLAGATLCFHPTESLMKKTETRVTASQLCTSFAVLLVILASASARADLIVGPVGVTEPPGVGSFGFINTINQSGLSIVYTSGVTDFDDYIALSPTHFGNNFTEGYTEAEPVVNIDYDLGAPLTIGRMALWFSRFPQSANPSQLQVITSLTSDFATPFDAGTFFPNDGRGGFGGTPAPVQVFDLADSEARYVRVSVLSKFANFGVFYSEVAFAQVTVPEPSALLMAVVFAVTACSNGRKRRP